jgi:Protein of unknown function (DUF1579)
MPEPTEHHRKLHALNGEWSGDETLYPSPWAPELRFATGAFSMRVAVDGLFLLSDYEESRDGQVVFRGHGVYGWDPKRERYTMYWVDSMGGSPNETTGVWSGDTLSFGSRGEHGFARYVYTIVDADHFTFSIETSRDGELWAKMMDGEFARRPG